MAMKYIFIIAALILVINASGQTTVQRTPGGLSYQVFTKNPGEKLKQNDIITFNIIQKTDKDSVLFSSYAAGHPVATQVRPSQNIADMMEVFPLLTLKDSAMILIPTDTMFKGHEEMRPPFLHKGSNLITVIKIEKAQTLDQYIADIKAAEIVSANKYVADHKLVLKTTPSGLRYVITQPTLKRKPLKGDTLLVNYAGRTLNDKVFDSSIESVAKGAGLQQPGRKYEPIEVIVGTQAVIAGWDEGLLLLNEGSKATFVIPSSLGYGERGQGDDIKPFSTLVFDVELVKVKPIKHAVIPPAAAPVKTHIYKKKQVTSKN